ncbi:MAG: matrixin family metalloprotease [Bradymonadia bacterium]
MSWRTVITTLSALGALASTANAYSFKTTDEGVPLRWPEGQVNYVIDGALARDVDDVKTLDAVHDAFDAWATADGTSLKMNYQGRADNLTIGYDPDRPDSNVNLVTWSRDTWVHAPEALAVTVSVYRASNGELVDADIIVNEAHYNWGMGGEAENDLQNALTHEVGHLLGLGHAPDEPEATMYPSASPGELEKRDLHHTDEEAISTLYPGDSAEESPVQAPPLPPEADEPGQAPASGGQRVGGSSSPGAAPADEGFTNQAGGCESTGGAGASLWALVALAGLTRRRKEGAR